MATSNLLSFHGSLGSTTVDMRSSAHCHWEPPFFLGEAVPCPSSPAVLLASPPLSPSTSAKLISYLLKYFRVQAKKPKSI